MNKIELSADVYGVASQAANGAGGPVCTILPQAKFFEKAAFAEALQLAQVRVRDLELIRAAAWPASNQRWNSSRVPDWSGGPPVA